MAKQTKLQLKPFIEKWAEKFAIDPALVYGVIMAESAGDSLAARFEPNYRYLLTPSLVRPAICSIQTEEILQKISIGLMQVMGAVYREYGYRGWLTSLFNDVDRQIQYGTKHLSKKVKKYGKARGISAYNAGVPTNKNTDYINKVLKFASEY